MFGFALQRNRGEFEAIERCGQKLDRDPRIRIERLDLAHDARAEHRTHAAAAKFLDQLEAGLDDLPAFGQFAAPDGAGGCAHVRCAGGRWRAGSAGYLSVSWLRGCKCGWHRQHSRQGSRTRTGHDRRRGVGGCLGVRRGGGCVGFDRIGAHGGAIASGVGWGCARRDGAHNVVIRTARACRRAGPSGSTSRNRTTALRRD